jgi:S-(hydroxymethyl)glutathione dehydrogenase/alcohol dehydrogenase
VKAAVCYEPGKPLVIEEVEVYPPDKDEVKVRLAATGICHSDIHTIKGEFPAKLPGIPGHESSGYVEEVGENVTSVKPGDHVVFSVMPSGCGSCRNCVLGLRHLCTNAAPWRPHHRNQKGEPLSPLAGPVGGFAEYTTVHKYNVVKIPENVPMDQAALMGCCVVTGFGAVINRAQVKPLASVVVIGAGGVGVNALQGAVYSGAYPIIAVDVLDKKLEMSRNFGATHTVNSTREKEPVNVIKQLTGGRGADYVFVTVGNAAAVRQGFSMLGPRGMEVIVGVSLDKFSFTATDFIGNEGMLTGCALGSTRLLVDVHRYVELYHKGALKLGELISGRYPLARINEAIESMESGEVLRNVIVF